MMGEFWTTPFYLWFLYLQGVEKISMQKEEGTCTEFEVNLYYTTGPDTVLKLKWSCTNIAEEHRLGGAF